MRSLALVLVMLLGGPALAQERFGADADPHDGAASETADEARAARLDLLFERLREAPSKRRADAIAANLQRRLLRSGSPTTDLLMQQAGKAVEAKSYGVALDILDSIVRLDPDYAEGWNRRATVHFLREDFGRSLADIERVLQLEPRHWGALTGLALILDEIDDDERALKMMDAALAVHPFLEMLKDRREKLAATLDGNRI